MKKKNLITITATVALVAAIGIGATLAYFTDSDIALNTVTMGHVDITLEEPEFSKNKDNTIEHVTPGQVIVKDPTIKVAADSEKAYIRASIDIDIVGDKKLTDARKKELKDQLLASIIEDETFDKESWTYGTFTVKENNVEVKKEYYYYNQIVNPGDSVDFFKTVKIPEKWNNDIADMTIFIDVTAEAIQADNFTPIKENGKIVAWEYSDKTPITAETYEKVKSVQ